MGFKNLFLKPDEDESSEQKEQPQQVKSFPTEPAPATTVFSSNPMASTPMSFGNVSNEHLAKFTEMYKNGFDSLNKDGYDFYEFYQAIMTSGGIDNPQMYQMAMSMGLAMDKTTTKEKLVNFADMYLTEINKVYTQYVSNGSTKKNDLVKQKEQENSALTLELSNLRQQLEAIQNQIQSKESQLGLIDNKYQPQINEVNEKLKANDIAKDNIVGTITKVKQGIINNVK
jgi:regulator of replication initiation timing